VAEFGWNATNPNCCVSVKRVYEQNASPSCVSAGHASAQAIAVFGCESATANQDGLDEASTSPFVASVCS
jgi:hypothetical protein